MADETAHGAGPDSRDREFDIVVYGATGFVGELVAAHLAEAAPRKRGSRSRDARRRNWP